MDIYCLSGLFFEDWGCGTGGWVCPNQLLLVRKGKSSLPSPLHKNAQHQPRMCTFNCTVIHGQDCYEKKGKAFSDCHLHISDICQVFIQGHYILTPLTLTTTIQTTMVVPILQMRKLSQREFKVTCQKSQSILKRAPRFNFFFFLLRDVSSGSGSLCMRGNLWQLISLSELRQNLLLYLSQSCSPPCPRFLPPASTGSLEGRSIN